jgi:predicted Zn-dependent peptidase
MEVADQAIEELVDGFVRIGITDEELDKVKNQSEATHAFSEVELLNRAMNIAFAANAGNAEWVNQDEQTIQNIEKRGIAEVARTILRPENCSTLYYHASQTN